MQWFTASVSVAVSDTLRDSEVMQVIEYQLHRHFDILGVKVHDVEPYRPPPKCMTDNTSPRHRAVDEHK